MASKNFSGTLIEPTGELANNDKIMFAQVTTTGEVIAGSVSIVKIGDDGTYDFDLQYGTISISTYNENSRRWIHQGTVTINSDTLVNTLPGLLNAFTPTTPAIVQQLEQILSDGEQIILDAQAQADSAASSALASEGFKDLAEQAATASANSANQSALNAVENGNVIKAILIAQGLSGDYGYFADGFTLNDPLDVGIDASYQFWKYVGAETLPYAVPQGTDPSAGDWELIEFNSASQIFNNDGSSVQDFIDNSAKVFATLSETLSYDALSVGDIVFINEIEVGKGASVIADIVSGETENGMTIFNHDSLPLQLKFRPRAIKPMIAFMFDDATRGHYEDVLPLAESYGFPISFNVATDFMEEETQTGTRLTTNELLDAQKRGVEIVNHSVTHRNLSSINSETTIIAEVETARQILARKGLSTVGFLAASSQVNQDYTYIFRNRTAYAFTVFANNNIDIAGINEKSNLYSLARMTMEGVSSSDTIQYIKDIVKFGNSAAFYEHAVENPSSAYTNLAEVFQFVSENSDIIDVQTPKDLISKHVGGMINIPKEVSGDFVFSSPDGWAFSSSLGAVSNGNNTITLTPSSTSNGTGVTDIDIEPEKTYTFSVNVRTGDGFTGSVSMGVHSLDSGGNVISGYSIEGGSIDYTNKINPRYALEFHTAPNAVKARLFLRVNPSVSSGQSLLIRDPAVYTGRRVIYDEEDKLNQPAVFPSEQFLNDSTPFSPVINERQDTTIVRLRVNFNGVVVALPTGTPTEGKTKIDFYLQANGTNYGLTFSGYYPNPNTVFTTLATSANMIVSFSYYRGRWIQVNDTAWIASSM